MTALRSRALLLLDVALKVALVALLLFGAFSGLERFEGEAFGGRAVTYPIAAIVVPIGWWIYGGRGGRGAYPYDLDILRVLPVLIDTAENALNLYDTIGWWDEFNLLLNWGILTAAFGRLLVRLPLGRVNVAALSIGFGAFTAVIWEFLEYVTFIRNSPELRTAYTDTLGDLLLGTSGSIVAAVGTALSLRRDPDRTSGSSQGHSE